MKPSLLFITGWAHGPDTLQPLGDALADRFDVQLLTGAQVLNDQRIPDADCIIAHSMGGLLAMERLPKRCKKLVLTSSTAKFCAGEDYPCGTPEKILRHMIRQLKRNPEAVLADFFRNTHYPNVSHTCAGVNYPLSTLEKGLEYLLASDARSVVPSIKIPVLLLHGTADRIIPPSASEWLHAHLPDSQLSIFEQAGHALPSHPFDEVMDEISCFL